MALLIVVADSFLYIFANVFNAIAACFGLIFALYPYSSKNASSMSSKFLFIINLSSAGIFDKISSLNAVLSNKLCKLVFNILVCSFSAYFLNNTGLYFSFSISLSLL